MKKKIVTLIILICAIVSVFAFAPLTAGASNGTCGPDLTWTLNYGSLVIKGSGPMTDWSEDEGAPWFGNIKSIYIGEGVTSIGAYAFNGCNMLSSITIPNTVEKIGINAFNWDSALSVDITDLYAWCNIDFADYTSNPLADGGRLYIDYIPASHIEIPDGITQIRDYAFNGCYNLESIVIPESVTEIGDYAFNGCNNLTEISLPDSLETIGEYAFCYCNALEEIIIPKNVTSFGMQSFSFCSSLSKVSIPKSITEISEGAFANCEKLVKVNIPETVTKICDGAFYVCEKLMKITIPDSVTEIGERAFMLCNNLESVTIGRGLNTIGRWAFSGCKKLTDVYYACSATEWEMISGSDDSSLDTVTIHYNYDSSAPHFKLSQQLVSGLDPIDGYSEYMSRATREFIFPGLNNGMVPQGIAYRDDTDEFYLTAYDGDGEYASVLMVIDAATGKYKKEFSVINIDGSDNKGHLGGVAVTKRNVFLTSGKNLLRISLSSIDQAGNSGEIQVEEKIALSLGDANLSYVSYDRKNNMLWVGNFYYFWDKDYNQKAYPKYNTLLVGYELISRTKNEFKNGMKANADSSYQYVPDAICNLDSYDRIQGAAFTDDALILSQSFGRGNKSKLYFFEYPRIFQSEKHLSIDGISVPICDVRKKNTITVFPMSEGIDVRNGKLYTVYESAAEKYLDGGKDKTEYVWGYKLDNYKGTNNYPVIVLPGIMGSTMKDTGGLGIPVLKGGSDFIEQSDLVIADTLAASTGADGLIESIRNSGDYEVYPCPYDWRLSIDDISDKYLKPLIEKAKKETGSEKVILVAHSMGGIVARNYIQSVGYNYDVDSLYMIGTPNEGSTAMVPLSLCGVPFDAAQAAVMSYNYNKMTGEDYNKASNAEIKRFIENKVFSTAQLLPAYDNYFYELETKKLSGKNINSFLTSLNRDALTCGKYQPINGKNKNKVRTILFASDNVDTPHSLEVVYHGATPYLKYTESFLKNKAAYITQAALSSDPYVEFIELIGDGTVLTNSATVSGKMKNIWTIERGGYGKHMKMFGGLADVISDYLDILPTMNLMSAQMQEENHSLQIDVSGADAALYINDELFAIENECRYIDDPKDGEYIIDYIKQTDEERVTVQFLYTNGEKSIQKTLSLLNDEGSVSFNISDGVLQYEDKTVSGIRSANSGGFAKLMWKNVDGAESYKIYKKIFGETQYSLLCETKETEFLTSDIWLDDFSENCICYYVIPVFADGTRGGYSESARNYNNAQAAFDYTIGEDGNTVSFADLSSGEISKWQWDFDGDGIVDSEEQNPEFTYGKDGVYSVTLTVSGASGTSVVTCKDAVKIGVYPVSLVVETENENIKVGESAALSAFILMSDDSRKDAVDTTFVSSDNSVMSIEGNNATAQKIGSANIIATAEGFTGGIELYAVVDKASVALSSQGYGLAEGSGEYQIGETIPVSAVPVNGEKFLGWYKGDSLISTDFDYWFEVTEDVELKAVFTKNNNVFVNAFANYCRYDGNSLCAKISYNYIFEDCTAFLAVYGKDGKLLKLTSQPVSKNSEYTEFVLATQDYKGFDYKVFFWHDVFSVTPVGKALEGRVE